MLIISTLNTSLFMHQTCNTQLHWLSHAALAIAPQ